MSKPPVLEPKKRELKLLLIVLISTVCCACNPLYVIRAGLTQSEILWNRRAISSLLEDPDTTPDIARKLELVTSARSFAQKIELSPGGSFESYSALDRDILAWIVLAAKPDSFEFYTWWFPIVGSVPYKGFFSPSTANTEAKRLQGEGYETLVRGTEAFSTLGWFNDPVMTPMLKNEDHEIVNTVIHEILHTTIWLPNFVAFNESLANFVGLAGAASYYKEQLQISTASALSEKQILAKKFLAESQSTLHQALEVSKTLSRLVPELTTLYQSDLTREAKITGREEVFRRHIEPLRSKYANLKILTRAHNAELMQLQLYYTKLDLFADLWDKQQGDWPAFFNLIREIVAETKESGVDPFRIAEVRLG